MASEPTGFVGLCGWSFTTKSYDRLISVLCLSDASVGLNCSDDEKVKR